MLAGAQTPLELVESWLSRSDQPEFRLRRLQPVYLSQHGFDALTARACDLACTDRPITPSEQAALQGRTVRGVRLAFYGYALYVHPSNPIDSVFTRHIDLVFQRKIVDWKELGGSPGPINLYGPRKSTRGGELLGRRARIWFADPTWEVCDSDTAIVDRVADDPQGLGFAAVGFDGPARYMGIREERHGPPAFPSLEAIEEDRYGFAKVIYAYFEEPASPAVSAALSFLQSDAGAAAMQQTDVWPIPPERSVVPAQP